MNGSTRTPRPGYTLVEIVLVVALILIVMAISVPVVQVMLDDARQTAAADMVRAKAAETRARAMESGKPWRLACIANTSVFQYAPEDSPAWESMEQTPTEELELIRDEMPKNILFAVNPSDLSGGSTQPTPGTEWQTIAVYLFDGSARADTTTYFGKLSHMPMGMELRGLTGSMTMRSPTEVMASQP